MNILILFFFLTKVSIEIEKKKKKKNRKENTILDCVWSSTQSRSSCAFLDE